MTAENVACSPVYIETSGHLVIAGIHLFEYFKMKTNSKNGHIPHRKHRAHRFHLSIFYQQLLESVAQKQGHDPSAKLVSWTLLL